MRPHPLTAALHVLAAVLVLPALALLTACHPVMYERSFIRIDELPGQGLDVAKKYVPDGGMEFYILDVSDPMGYPEAADADFDDGVGWTIIAACGTGETTADSARIQVAAVPNEVYADKQLTAEDLPAYADWVTCDY